MAVARSVMKRILHIVYLRNLDRAVLAASTRVGRMSMLIAEISELVESSSESIT